MGVVIVRLLIFTVINTPDDKIIGLARLPSNRDAFLRIRLGTRECAGG